ncbi:hypothetical protein WMO40_22360 [Bacillaceae bacterium CLA-AA-H227]|uniref:Uncharacterized protein n=1 Tax=Robertmurraya yapensis (ex Hitch et al 2024) TaxID=3133160 RepID=A0ACC6SHX6_9BACI
MRKSIKGNKHQTVPSDYQEGRTNLTAEQLELLHNIASVVYHYDPEHFDNIALNYAPSGLIKILKDQVYVRFTNDSITHTERNDALALIDKLSISLDNAN